MLLGVAVHVHKESFNSDWLPNEVDLLCPAHEINIGSISPISLLTCKILDSLLDTVFY